ncbi:MAG: sugar phosphate isomerase/epimerase family protein [Spirosomataceae bacterium]
MEYSVALGMVSSKRIPVPLGGDLIEQMFIAKEIGYDSVELHIPHPSVINLKEVQEKKNTLGLKISTIGTGSIVATRGLTLTDADPTNRLELLRILKEFIDCAQVLGSNVTIGSVKGNSADGFGSIEGDALLGSAMQEISAYAVEKDVILLLEATNRYENNILNRAEEVVSLISRYKLENTQALLDTFHCNIEEPRFSTCIVETGDLLGHIHFADNTRLYPGAGSMRLADIVSQVKAINYDGVLSIECLPEPNGIEAATRALDFLRRNFG